MFRLTVAGWVGDVKAIDDRPGSDGLDADCGMRRAGSTGLERGVRLKNSMVSPGTHDEKGHPGPLRV